jgi:hypothetical protein
MRCPTPGHSPYPSRIGNGVTARRDGLPGRFNLDEKILNTRKTLLDIIVDDKKIIKSKEEKLKTLDTFKRIWSATDDKKTRKETFKLLGKSTLAISK